MCRSQAEGGRRCPGSHSGSSSGPPADGKTRIEVHTNKRSYSVIGGQSKVAWMPGEKVVSMDVIDPSQPDASKTAGHAGDSPRTAAHHHCYCAGSHKPGCPNYGVSGAMPPLADDDQRESYRGTRWQGYDEHNQRADEINRRVYEGESITDIMSAEHVRRGEERIAQITREGW